MAKKFKVIEYSMPATLENELNKEYNEGYEPVFFNDHMVVFKHTGVTQIL